MVSHGQLVAARRTPQCMISLNDFLRAERLETLKCPLVAALTPEMSVGAICAASRICMAVCCLSVSQVRSRFGFPWPRGVPLGMSRIRPEFLDPDRSDCSVAADVVLRQERDEEEDEEEDEGDRKEDDDNDDNDNDDDGYSE
jgi:hypothetical protein